MQISKKYISIFIVILVLIFIAGFAAGFLTEKFVPIFGRKTLYESRANVIFADANANQNTLSSADLVVALRYLDTIEVILQSDSITGRVCKEYPEADFTLSLDAEEGAILFTIVATSENPENLSAICNRTATLLCERVPEVLEYSCKILDYAKQPMLIED